MTKPTNSDEVDADFDAYLNALNKSDAWLARAFVIFGVVALIVMSGIFGYFNVVGGAAFETDLWLAADRSARPGSLVLVEAASRDPKTGKQLLRPNLYLEQWEGEALVEAWPIQGELRRAVRMGEAPLRFRVAVPDKRIGEFVAEVRVEPSATGHRAMARERVGGAKPPPGAAGFHVVRTEGTCGWNIEAVALGGVPVAHVGNTVLFRVTDREGRPVENTRLVRGESSVTLEPLAPVTDAEGVAVFGLRPAELSYVEVRAVCGEGAHLSGFEVQPVFDGISVDALTWGTEGLVANVDRVSLELDALYDVRCEGELVEVGRLGRGDEVRVSRDAFSRYDAGTTCVFQVYRGAFGVPGARAVRPFLLGEWTRGWLWERHARGVAFVRGGDRVQASAAGDAALLAWQSRGYERIRLWMGVVLGSSLLLWLMVTMLSVRGRRAALGRLRRDDADDSESGLALRWLPMLLMGWVGIVLMLGGMWFVLWLMGL